MKNDSFSVASSIADLLEAELNATFVGGSQPLAPGKINLYGRIPPLRPSARPLGGARVATFVTDINGVLYEITVERHGNLKPLKTKRRVRSTRSGTLRERGPGE